MEEKSKRIKSIIVFFLERIKRPSKVLVVYQIGCAVPKKF